MNHDPLPGGVWPVMLTPFDQQGTVDWDAYEELVEFYVRTGASGLFAVCMSSESEKLTAGECVELVCKAKAVAGERLPIVAGVACKDTGRDLRKHVISLREAGADAAVLIPNEFVSAEDSDEVLRTRLFEFLETLDEDIPLGIYECPVPHHRLISADLLKEIAQTNRFLFMKDTSCKVSQLSKKVDAVKGSPLRVYNAHAGSLLDGISLGVHGYSGVGCNFFSEPFVWPFQTGHSCHRQLVEYSQMLINRLDEFLSIENAYPKAAKAFLRKRGLSLSETCRVSREMSHSLRGHIDVLWDDWTKIEFLVQEIITKDIAD